MAPARAARKRQRSAAAATTLDTAVDAEAEECDAPRGETRADRNRGLHDLSLIHI